MQENLQWCSKLFSQLTTNELYDILKLRVDVFVVEQTCYYPEIDEHDKHTDTIHLFAYSPDEITPIAAYLRILAKGTSYKDNISIGRVVVAKSFRGRDLGKQLMQKALKICNKHFAEQSIKISAQEHLEAFYNELGFIRISEMYLEDNIPHIAMLLSKNKE